MLQVYGQDNDATEQEGKRTGDRVFRDVTPASRALPPLREKSAQNGSGGTFSLAGDSLCSAKS